MKRPIMRRVRDDRQGDLPLPVPSLANRFLRQLQSHDGATRAMALVPGMFDKDYALLATKSRTAVRDELISAKKMALSRDFVKLSRDLFLGVNAEVSSADGQEAIANLRALWAFGELPFDPLWIEWDDSAYTFESENAADYHALPSELSIAARGFNNTGVLLTKTDVDGEEGITMRLIYSTPDDPMICVMPPIGICSRAHTTPFSPDKMGATSSAMLFRDVNDNPLPALKHVLGQHLLTLHAHSGGIVALDLLKTLTRDKKDMRAAKLLADQVELAYKLIRTLIVPVPTYLGLISLAPVRHVVDTQRVTRPPGTESEWRWKHEHDLVFLKRPITEREVVRHIKAAASNRASPMLHDVMGFWRVVGGRPSCNHIWHEEEPHQGTATDLGRPHRTDHHRFRCSPCHALRTWVRSHMRGTPERGLRSKDYVVGTGR